MWERPEDLLGRPDVDKAISTTPEQLLSGGAQKDESKTATEVAAVAEASKKRPESESSDEDAETANKKQKLDTVVGGAGKRKKQN